MSFALLSEKQIRTPRWANIWFTLSSSKCEIRNNQIPTLTRCLTQFGRRGRKYNELCYDLAELLNVKIGKAAQIICYAIYHGEVFVDTFSTAVISENTIIRKKVYINVPTFQPLYEELNLLEGYIPDPPQKEPELKNEDDEQDTVPIRMVPQKYQETVKKRLEIVKEWRTKPQSQRTAPWRTKFCEKWNVSKTTVYNWVKTYEQEGVKGLIPNYSKGGRKSQFDQKTLELLEKARQKYLNPDTTSRTAHDYLGKLCEQNGIEPPSYRTFRYYISRNKSEAEYARRRRGRTHYMTHYSLSLGSFQGATMPMQVLQLDNTSFDVHLVDTKTRSYIGTPHLCSMIDLYTRMITGIFLSIEPINSQSVLETLVQSILPKHEYVQKYDLELDWPIQGIPMLILVDHGKDFQSKAVREFCKQYRIIFESVPQGTPRYKAHIESWFRTLHFKLKNEEVAGRRPLQRDRLENPDLKPEKDATYTLPEMEEWLYLGFTEWHYSPSSDELKQAPFIRWEDAKNGQTKVILPAPRDPPIDDWEISFLRLFTFEREKRVLSGKGVQWDNIEYNNNELGQIYQITGRTKVEVLRNRRDIRTVVVISPIDEKPLIVEATRGWRATFADRYGNWPVSSSLWQSDLKRIRKQNITRITPYSARKAMQKIKREELLERGKKETKRVKKEREIAIQTERRYRDDPFRDKPLEIPSEPPKVTELSPEEQQERRWSSFEEMKEKIARRKRL